MSTSLRQIKNRIRGTENIWKITRAMQMISILKLKRIEDLLLSQRDYFKKMDSLVKNLLSASDEPIHPYLEKKKKAQKIMLCLITSDAGLCAMYNDSIIREAEAFIRGFGREKVKLLVIGKKGVSYFKRKGYAALEAYGEFHGRYSGELLEGLVKQLSQSFLENEVDEVYVAYMRFGSAFRYTPTIEKILNIEFPKEEPVEYIVEPDREAVLAEIIPAFVFQKLRLILFEAFTSEHSARTVAMKSATDNAQDLIESLVLLRNKVRQSAITKEVLEVISSSEALKG